MRRVRIAVAGAGLIGLRHIEETQKSADCELSAIVDPSPKAAEIAQKAGVPLYGSLGELFAKDQPDGVVLATPNQMHVEQALECIAAGVPALVEKPVAHTLAEGERLCEAAERRRRSCWSATTAAHSPIMDKAVEIVARVCSAGSSRSSGSAVFYKPERLLRRAPWRREPGGGPILLNMIHEVGNLRAMVGEIVAVQAFASNATRGFAVEDTVAINLRFANGALGTFLLSDTAASPRSWEQTSQENKATRRIRTRTATSSPAPTARSRCRRCASRPTRGRRTGRGGSRSQTSVAPLERADPLARQIEHFGAVIRGEAKPLVTARDGLQNLRVVDAIVEAAKTGRIVETPIRQPLEAKDEIMKKFLMLHGINHDMFGKREPKQYGTITLDEIDDRTRRSARSSASRSRASRPTAKARCASASTRRYATGRRRAHQRRRVDALQLRTARRARDPDRADRRDPHVEHPRARGVPAPLGDLAEIAKGRSPASASTATCSACGPPVAAAREGKAAAMIIKPQSDVTAAVLAELERAADPRFREIMSAAVRHLHAWVREVRLTEAEFQQACAIIAKLGQLTNKSHNEVVLIAGSLGVSSLVCLLNNGDRGQAETTANLLGPFWRTDSPRTENGASIVRSPTPGDPIFVTARVVDRHGRPVADAEVDVWHTSAEGIYENQDPAQADMNLRGKFTTDAEGQIGFRSVKPIGYPIPVNGPVGRAAARAGPAQPAAGAHPLPDLQAGLQDAVLAGVLERRPEPRDRRAVRRDRGADRQVRAPRERAGARRRRQGRLVLARPRVRDRARRGEAAARADHRQGERRAAADRRAGADAAVRIGSSGRAAGAQASMMSRDRLSTTTGVS